jgi:hypothetical protein
MTTDLSPLRLLLGEFLFETQESRFSAGDRVANRLLVERRRSHAVSGVAHAFEESMPRI